MVAVFYRYTDIGSTNILLPPMMEISLIISAAGTAMFPAFLFDFLFNECE